MFLLSLALLGSQQGMEQGRSALCNPHYDIKDFQSIIPKPKNYAFLIQSTNQAPTSLVPYLAPPATWISGVRTF